MTRELDPNQLKMEKSHWFGPKDSLANLGWTIVVGYELSQDFYFLPSKLNKEKTTDRPAPPTHLIAGRETEVQPSGSQLSKNGESGGRASVPSVLSLLVGVPDHGGHGPVDFCPLAVHSR
jgi:hypothetical protein